MAGINQFPNCGENVAVTGVSCDANILTPAKPFVTKLDFEYATYAAATDEDTHKSGITAENVFPFPEIEEFADNSEEDTSNTSTISGVKRLVRRGKTVHQYSYVFNPDLNNRLQTFNNRTMRYYYADVANNMIATSPDGTVVKGFEVLISVKKWMSSTGDNLSYSIVEFTYLNNDERELNVAAFPATFNLRALEGAIPATLTISSTTPPTATDIVVTVTDDNGNPITGLDENYVRYIEADGVTEEVIATFVATSTPGEYTASATAFTTGGTLNLYDQTNSVNVITLGTMFYKGNGTLVTIA